MRVRRWKYAIVAEMLLLVVSSGWAQSKLLTVSMKPYGWDSMSCLCSIPTPNARVGSLRSAQRSGVA